MCVEAWRALQQSTFLHAPRYKTPDAGRIDLLDNDYHTTVKFSLVQFVQQKTSTTLHLCAPKGASAPFGSWSIKQKSKLQSAPMTIKLRPIIRHHLHPNAPILGRVARAVSLIVKYARTQVQQRIPTHHPLWELHSGSRDFLIALRRTHNPAAIIEYDVEDCFLNTPQQRVRPAAEYWIAVLQQTRRRALSFAISKDSRKLDRLGPSFSLHFWELSVDVVLAVIDWEVSINLDFTVQSNNGDIVALQQHKGLPIGGSLSAGLVELVALHMEATKQWPSALHSCPSVRYRDNLFVCVQRPWSSDEAMALCPLLSELYQMPIKLEGSGATRRFLELRITLNGSGSTKAVLAYRTDPDRQGESGDVAAWPPWQDPRTRTLLRGLLIGLASKLVNYHVDGIVGFGASLRQAVGFLRKRGYPSKAWLRPFALALLHRGMLPKSLQKVVGGVKSQHKSDLLGYQHSLACLDSPTFGGASGFPSLIFGFFWISW